MKNGEPTLVKFLGNSHKLNKNNSKVHQTVLSGHSTFC